MKDKNSILKCIGYSALTGFVTGIIIFLFKFLAHEAEAVSRQLYIFAKGSFVYVALTFAILVILAFVMCFIHLRVPEAKGGGIPRSEGIIRGIITFRPIRTLFATFFGSILSFFAGIGVGSEGPSVLMGTCVGKIFPHKNEGSAVMTAGASAGFAAATGAPLSSIIFALEEVHKRFDSLMIMNVCIAVMVSSGINQALCSFFDMSPYLFEIEKLTSPKLSHMGYLVLLGVVIAIFVALFDFAISFLSHIAKRKGFSLIKLITVFLLSGAFALYFSHASYSGHHVIEHILEKNHSMLFLFGVLVIRMIMLILTCDSGVTGGIFIPSLAIGALVSAITAGLLVEVGLPLELYDCITFLGTCAFIGGVMRAPIMAAVLFVELTGQYTSLLYVVTVIFITNVLTEIIGKKCFYDRVIENMTEHNI